MRRTLGLALVAVLAAAWIPATAGIADTPDTCLVVADPADDHNLHPLREGYPLETDIRALHGGKQVDLIGASIARTDTAVEMSLVVATDVPVTDGARYEIRWRNGSGRYIATANRTGSSWRFGYGVEGSLTPQPTEGRVGERTVTIHLPRTFAGVGGSRLEEILAYGHTKLPAASADGTVLEEVPVVFDVAGDGGPAGGGIYDLAGGCSNPVTPDTTACVVAADQWNDTRTFVYAQPVATEPGLDIRSLEASVRDSQLTLDLHTDPIGQPDLGARTWEVAWTLDGHEWWVRARYDSRGWTFGSTRLFGWVARASGSADAERGLIRFTLPLERVHGGVPGATLTGFRIYAAELVDVVPIAEDHATAPAPFVLGSGCAES